MLIYKPTEEIVTTTQITVIDKTKLSQEMIDALAPALKEIKIKTRKAKRESINTRIEDKMWERFGRLARDNPEIQTKFRFELVSIMLIQFLVKKPWLTENDIFQKALTRQTLSRTGKLSERGGGATGITQRDIELGDVVDPDGNLITARTLRNLVFTASEKLQSEGVFAVQFLRTDTGIITKNGTISESTFIYSFLLWVMHHVFPEHQSGKYPHIDNFRYKLNKPTNDVMYVTADEIKDRPASLTGRASLKWQSVHGNQQQMMVG